MKGSKKILQKRLNRKANIIFCSAWGLDNITAQFLPHLKANRRFILEMKNRDGDLSASEDRNRFVD